MIVARVHVAADAEPTTDLARQVMAAIRADCGSHAFVATVDDLGDWAPPPLNVIPIPATGLYHPHGISARDADYMAELLGGRVEYLSDGRARPGTVQ